MPTGSGKRVYAPQKDKNTSRDSQLVSQSRLGLRTILEPNDETTVVVDVVFLHGLTGDSYNTWLDTTTNTYWPADLLKNDIKNARAFTFGYDTDVVDFWNPASQNRIGNHAENLLGALVRRRERTETEERKIIFVAHSLGGLLVEEALRLSRSSPEKHILQIEKYTVGIAFMGTPHFGADLASWGRFGSIMINILNRSNADIVAVLEPGSEMLANIQKGFHSILRLRRDEGSEIAITCFYEELPMAVVGLVVPKHSAILPGYSGYGIHANHMHMTKFGDSEDYGYESVVGEIRRWTKSLTVGLSKITGEIFDNSASRSDAETSSGRTDPQNNSISQLNSHTTISPHLTTALGEITLETLPPLHRAAVLGKEEEAMAWLDDGFPIDEPSFSGETALHMAVLGGHKRLINILMSKNANINARTKGGRSVLHLAVSQKSLELCRAVLKCGAYVDAVDAKLQTALHLVAILGYVDIMYLLLAWGADVFAPDESGNTPAECALIYKNHWMANYLVDKESDNTKRYLGQTNLHRASERGNAKSVTRLLGKGAELNETDDNGNTALHLSSGAGHEIVVQILLDHNAKKSLANNSGKTALDLAKEANYEVIVSMLQQFAEPATQPEAGWKDIAHVGADGVIFTELRLTKSFIGHSQLIQTLAFSPDGRLLASSSMDELLKVWDVESGLLFRTFRGHAKEIWSVSFSFDGHLLSTGSEDMTIRICKCDGSLQQVLTGHSGPVTSVAFSSDDALLASASLDKTIRIWSLGDWSQRWCFERTTPFFPIVAFSPVGHLLAFGSSDSKVDIWDAVSGELQHVLEFHRGVVRSLSWSSNNQMLAILATESTVLTWDLRIGSLPQYFEVQSKTVDSLNFLRNSHLLVAVSLEGAIMVLDPMTGSQLQNINIDISRGWTTAFSPTNRMLAIGETDGSIKIWKACVE